MVKRSKEQYEESARNSNSISNMCRYLGLIPCGGNFSTMKKNIVLHSIDVYHFDNLTSLDVRFSENPKSKKAIKDKLIRDRGHQCEKCNNEQWLDEPITLELEHIDGNNSNNENGNLLLLCPNCHSYTKTWRRAKSSFKEKKVSLCKCGNTKTEKALQYQIPFRKRDVIISHNKIGANYNSKTKKNLRACGKEKHYLSKRCKKCDNENRATKIVWPDTPTLRKMVEEENYSAVAKKLRVTDNSIRKRIANH